jgi:23S rRNA (adenine2030-N6)-methyltransferase
VLARLSVAHPTDTTRGYGMLGSLVFVANPPHTLAPALRKALPFLADMLAEDEAAAGWACESS